MSTLVVLDRGALRLHTPATGAVLSITGADAANRQPTWSPDGRLLAWSRYDRRSTDSMAKLAIVDRHNETRVEHDIVFPAFYMHWRPDAKAIAMLGEGPLGLELTTIDIATGESAILSRGGPLFFDWHDDNSLLANLGEGDSRRFEYYGQATGEKFSSLSPASFTAPARLPGTDRFIAAVRDGGHNRLAILDRAGQVERTLATFGGYVRFAPSPDGRRVAWVCGKLADGAEPVAATPGEPHAAIDQLVVHDLATGLTTPVAGKMPITFEWSPNSARLLYLSIDDIGAARWMRWHVWSDSGISDHDWCRPSAIEAREYLPFSEQHGRGQHRWAADSESFCYSGTATSGQEGVWVQSIDHDDAEHLTTGQMCWFAPK